MEFLKNKIKAMRTFATETALSSALGAYDGEVVSVSVTGNVYVWKSATGTWEIQVKRNTDGSYVLPFGSVSATGAWTMGVLDGTAAHIINGNLLQIRRSDNSKLRLTPSGSTAYFDSYGVDITTNGTYSFRSARSDDSNSITLGTVGGTGIWTLGQTSSPNYDNVCHVINGGLKVGGSTSSSSGARLYIGTNFNAFDHTATSRTSTTFSGGGISFDNSSAGNGVIAFYANQAGDALSTDADLVGTVTDAGAWTFPINTTHTFGQNAGSGGSTPVKVQVDSTGSSYVSFVRGITRDGLIGGGPANNLITGAAAGDLNVMAKTNIVFGANEGSAVHGKVDTAGAWTLGPLGGTGAAHTIVTGNSWIRTDDSTAANRSGANFVLNSGSSGRYAQLILDPNGANSTGTDYFSLMANQAGDVTITNYGVNSANISNAGSWNLGPSTGGSLTHYIRSGGATTDLDLVSTGTTSGSSSIIYINGYGARWYLTLDHATGRFYVLDKDANQGVYIVQDSAAGWVINSDIRMKKNVSDLESGLETILAIRPRQFLYNNDADDHLIRIGFVAQELAQYIPQAVSIPEVEEAMWGVAPDALVPVLVKAIQEQQQQIEQLQSEIVLLKGA